MKFMLVALTLASSAALAQAVATEFPAGATNLSADALKAAVSGKVFAVQPASGPAWRWQFQSTGYHFINVGNFADTGKWEAKDSTLCTEGRNIKYSCNEIRVLGADLYLKRDSGEVVKMVAQ